MVMVTVMFYLVLLLVLAVHLVLVLIFKVMVAMDSESRTTVRGFLYLLQLYKEYVGCPCIALYHRI